jgi:hypothetical protein
MSASVVDKPRFPTRADYGAAVKALLCRARLSSVAAAEHLQISRATMGRITAGRAPLYVHQIFMLADLTGTDPLDVLRDAYAHAGLPLGK